MKSFIIGVVLVLFIGVVGFAYRNNIEQIAANVQKTANAVQLENTACTADAKVCPDGSAVGRTGPNCSFAECAPPNVQFTIGSSTIGFVLPSGYTTSAGAEGSQIASYTKPSESSTPHTISIDEYPTPAGETGEQVMLSNTVFNPSGLQATSTNAFSTAQIANQNFYVVTTNHASGQIDTSYFLLRTSDVLRFEIDEQGVASSSDPNLNISALPEHQALTQMLATLQITTN